MELIIADSVKTWKLKLYFKASKDFAVHSSQLGRAKRKYWS